jgi:hypothetical protein
MEEKSYLFAAWGLENITNTNQSQWKKKASPGTNCGERKLLN